MAVSSVISDMLSPITVSILSIAAVTLFLVYLTRKSGNLPPGPIGIPYFGYAPFLGKFPHQVFNKLSKKYGNVMSFNMLGRRAIVLQDLKHIKEGYSKPAFLGTGLESLAHIMPNGTGLFELNGKPWQEQRRFFVRAVKVVGFSNDRFSELFKQEICEFLRYLKKVDGNPVDFFQDVTFSLINVIMGVVTLKRFERNHPTALMLKNTVNQFVFFFEGADLILLPLIKKILSYFTRVDTYDKVKKAVAEMDDWFCKEIEEHKKDIDRDHPRDFIDHYLIEMESQQVNPDTSFTDKMLLAVTVMLFLTGNVDTRSGLYWLILCMAGYPDIQSRAQAEIDEVLGSDRFPTWEDHLQLPYVEAVLRETHRWKPSIPISCLRKALEDTTVGGYEVPKDSIVFANIWAVQNDKGYWKDPENYRPERHLDVEGKTLIQHDNYIPFSYGKRQCPGEKFANMELFLYLVAILQQFNIRMPTGKEADFTEYPDLNVHPKPQLLCFIPRH